MCCLPFKLTSTMTVTMTINAILFMCIRRFIYSKYYFPLCFIYFSFVPFSLYIYIMHVCFLLFASSVLESTHSLCFDSFSFRLKCSTNCLLQYSSNKQPSMKIAKLLKDFVSTYTFSSVHQVHVIFSVGYLRNLFSLGAVTIFNRDIKPRVLNFTPLFLMLTLNLNL